VIPGLGVGANQRCQQKALFRFCPSCKPNPPTGDGHCQRPPFRCYCACCDTDRFPPFPTRNGGQYAHSSGIGQCHVKKQTWNKQKPEWDTKARRQLLFACARPSRLPCFFWPCNISNIDRVTANSRGNQHPKTEKKQSSKTMVSTIVQ